jgi:pyruvate/2-oxoacid:ferredoxin oxidoreductase alpha subunit
MLAFELSDRYRNPAVVLSDAYIGEMMEPVEFPDSRSKVPHKDWALYGNAASRNNLITFIHMNTKLQEEHNLKLQGKYRQMEEKDVRFEALKTDDAEIILIGYGIVSRVLLDVMDELRTAGIRAGIIRPVTLFPYPKKIIEQVSGRAERFIIVELSNGQMADDVKLAVNGKRPVHLYTRMGGTVPGVRELIAAVKGFMNGE